MKRLLALLLVPLLAGCVQSAGPSDVVVASYPAAFLVGSLAGDDLRVVELGTGGLHHFEPSARDLDALRKTTHLILWDEGLEAWAHGAEKSLGRSAPQVYEAVRLPDGDVLLGPDGEPLDGAGADGTGHSDDGQAGHEDGHAGDGEHEDGHTGHDEHDGQEGHDGHAHEAAYDPHTWIDPLAMRASAEALAAHLRAAYPQHADNITARQQDLAARLDALHDAFATGLDACRHDTIVTNHDAYAYLARRYGFDVHSLHGVAPGAEPTPETVQQAIQAIRDLGLPVFFIEEGTDPGTVRAIQQETNVQVRVLHTLETRPDTGDYVDAQHENLQALRAALDCA